MAALEIKYEFIVKLDVRYMTDTRGFVSSTPDFTDVIVALFIYKFFDLVGI